MSKTVGRRRTFGTAALVIAAVVLAGCTTHSGSQPEAAGTAGNPPATSSSPSTSTGRSGLDSHDRIPQPLGDGDTNDSDDAGRRRQAPGRRQRDGRA